MREMSTSAHVSKRFRPRMEAKINDLRTLRPLSYRTFAGAVADVWHVQGDVGGGGFYIAPDPRLVVFLDDVPPNIALQTRKDAQEYIGVRAFFVPEGVPLWSRLLQEQVFSHIDFHLDAGALQLRLSQAGMWQIPEEVVFAEDKPELVSLSRMAAAEVENPRRGDLLIEGLLQALLGEVLDVDPQSKAIARGGLSPQQLRSIERYVKTHISRAISVAELAKETGLSESWFSRAFKQSIGVSPKRWICEYRVAAAQNLIRTADLPLSEIALAIGFADQAHLSRAFRQIVGQPPSLWRRTLSA